MFSKISTLLALAVFAGSFVALGHPTNPNNIGRDVDTTASFSLGDEPDANFPGCDTTQQETLQRAIAVATRYQQNARDYFQRLGPHPAANANLTLYTPWFGAYNPANYKTVYDRFMQVNSYPLDSWTYYCRPVLKPGNCGGLLQFVTIAASDASQLNDATNTAPIEICKGFWIRNAIHKDDRLNAQTIFHESTHFHYTDHTGTDIPGTNHELDEDYGEGFCRSLARDHPADAGHNADNYAFFARFLDIATHP
ncbi:hypothetical protein EYR38_003307 [Pleurotus pulmonarius]|nr:hypothetical protein EYR38_003307 [Pleurotus pulmonarius]